ncbi:MAG: thiamine phosphate synthase [Chlamydiota bacterium]
MTTRSRIGLYIILDRALLGDRDPAAVLRSLLDAGAGWFQYRDKRASDEEVAGELARLGPLCRSGGARLLVNDRAHLAASRHADGVHLGASDMAVGEARRLLGPGKIIGRSAQTVDEALRARDEGADYLGAGAVYPTTTKGDAAPLGVAGLAAICRAAGDLPSRIRERHHSPPPVRGRDREGGRTAAENVGVRTPGIPVVAIGGITRARAAEVLAAGASGVAVASAVLSAADPGEAARGIVEEIGRFVRAHGSGLNS